MSEIRNGLFVEYCAKDILDGTQMLGPWEELAYRRIIDMIYATNDSLADDDRKLAWMTKAGTRWKAIRDVLIAAGKIEAVDGRITNARCRKELEKSARKILQRSGAGKASAATGKSLNNLNQHRTDVPDAILTEPRTNYQPTNPSKKEEKPTANAVAKNRGTRLPDDFVVSEEWIDQANAARVNAGLPIADLRTEGVKFVNYWSAKSGQGATKANWLRTWINWALNAKASNGTSSNGHAPLLDYGNGAEFSQWRARMKGREKLWLDSYGPPPGKPGCKVPPQILTEFGMGAGT